MSIVSRERARSASWIVTRNNVGQFIVHHPLCVYGQRARGWRVPFKPEHHVVCNHCRGLAPRSARVSPDEPVPCPLCEASTYVDPASDELLCSACEWSS